MLGALKLTSIPKYPQTDYNKRALFVNLNSTGRHLFYSVKLENNQCSNQINKQANNPVVLTVIVVSKLPCSSLFLINSATKEA
jgi:hypothetical protein